MREFEAYQLGHADTAARNAQVIGISTDRLKNQKRFAQAYPDAARFIADSDARIVSLYGVKLPLVKLAKRVTFVVGQDGRVLHIDTGGDAIQAGNATAACPVPKGR